MMKLTVLGSGSCIPYPSRGNPGYLIEVNDSRLLMLDGGSGALRKVADYGYDYRNIHHICYTHLHPDHTLDIIPLLFALKNDRSRESPFKLDLFGPRGLITYWNHIQEAFGDLIRPDDDIHLQIHEKCPGDVFEVAGLQVAVDKSFHTENSLAFRLSETTGESSIVYSGDTGFSERLATFASQAGLFIVECAIPDNEKYEKHSSPKDVGRMASLANARTIMLTHFYPVMESENILTSVQKLYDGNVLLAEDGMKYVV